MTEHSAAPLTERPEVWWGSTNGRWWHETSAEHLISAARVKPHLTPARESGLWTVRHLQLPEDPLFQALTYAMTAGLNVGGHYTALTRWTDATLHKQFGDVVMEDTPRELRKHLPILLNARGRVLVTGLGLGCVVRGLLERPDVHRIDVVEISDDVLRLVGGEFEGNPRVALHRGDAETIRWPAGTRWDFAWHDLWSEHEPLDALHLRILARYRDMVGRQGAWGMKRPIKRRVRRLLPFLG
jgi:hypothetical protein